MDPNPKTDKNINDDDGDNGIAKIVKRLKDANKTKILSEQKDESDSICVRTCNDKDEVKLMSLFYEVNRQIFKEGFQKIIKNYIIYIVSLSNLGCYAVFGYDYRTFIFGLVIIPSTMYLLLTPLLGNLMASGIMRKETDFKDGLVKYYNAKPGKRQLICIELNTGNKKEIVGMVCVDEANLEMGLKGGPSHHKGLRKEGDAEMKRMNVDSKYQGRGLSKILFAHVVNFCQESQYKRIVLSTSSFNYVACTFLYPKLGFKTLNRHTFAKNMEGVFFALDLSEIGSKNSNTSNEINNNSKSSRNSEDSSRNDDKSK